MASIIPLSDTSRRFLLFLGDDLWRRVLPSQSSWQGHYVKNRALTAQEWRRVNNLVRSHELPCELHSDDFGIAIYVFDHSAVPDVPPERLCFIGQDNLPGFSSLREYRERCSTAWKTFSPLTHSNRNKELLEFYGLQPSREERCYEA